MNALPAETLYHIFKYLNQDDLARMSMTNRKHCDIVQRYFGEFPRHRNRSLTIRYTRSNKFIATIERLDPRYMNGRVINGTRKIIYNMETLETNLRPKFIEFDGNF